MDLSDTETERLIIPRRTWLVWSLFAASLLPLVLIGLNWNAAACCFAVLFIAAWLAIGFKYYNGRGFFDPFDFLASISIISSIGAIGVAIWRWVAY